jgi:hypothetical protein
MFIIMVCVICITNPKIQSIFYIICDRIKLIATTTPCIIYCPFFFCFFYFIS